MFYSCKKCSIITAQNSNYQSTKGRTHIKRESWGNMRKWKTKRNETAVLGQAVVPGRGRMDGAGGGSGREVQGARPGSGSQTTSV